MCVKCYSLLFAFHGLAACILSCSMLCVCAVRLLGVYISCCASAYFVLWFVVYFMLWLGVCISYFGCVYVMLWLPGCMVCCFLFLPCVFHAVAWCMYVVMLWLAVHVMLWLGVCVPWFVCVYFMLWLYAVAWCVILCCDLVCVSCCAPVCV